MPKAIVIRVSPNSYVQSGIYDTEDPQLAKRFSSHKQAKGYADRNCVYGQVVEIDIEEEEEDL